MTYSKTANIMMCMMMGMEMCFDFCMQNNQSQGSDVRNCIYIYDYKQASHKARLFFLSQGRCKETIALRRTPPRERVDG